MYANILLSTDGSDVARKGVKAGIALAKALSAKATVITVTEPFPFYYGSRHHASGWIPSQEEFDRYDAACKEDASKVLDEARVTAEQTGISAELFFKCAPSHCDYRNSKVQRLRLNRHGLSWASRPQQAILGESNIGGPGGRKRAGVGSALADTNDVVSPQRSCRLSGVGSSSWTLEVSCGGLVSNSMRRRECDQSRWRQRTRGIKMSPFVAHRRTL